MLVYPQLDTGALTQFPLKRRRVRRTIANYLGDGRAIKLPDPAGVVTEWTLPYSGLSDGELAKIQQFFEAAEGTLHGFTFLDPAGNLLARTEELDHDSWQKGPLITIEGADRGCLIRNGGAGPQQLTQTISAPPEYVYCLSAYVRSSNPTTITMLVGERRSDREVTTEWRRIIESGQSIGTTRFGMELVAGADVEVFGIQVEPQSAPSLYQASTKGGVYDDARLGDDTLVTRASGVNRHSCTVKIIHAEHL